MFRGAINSVLLRNTPLIEATVNGNPFLVQSVRWRRKPRWIPTAKSKLFRVPERKEEDPEERKELMRLHSHYKTKMRAVRSYLMEEAKIREATSTADHLVVTEEEEELEFQKCLQENKKWNDEIALIREQRLEKERKKQREVILTRLDAKEERIRERRERAEELIRVEKERSKTFITRENIDEAIEVALANTTNYDFAIDLQGNYYTEKIEPGKPRTPEQSL